MRHASGQHPSIQSVIDLLQNAEFCRDALRIIEAAKPLYTQASSPEEWQRLVTDLVQPFKKRWGVVPPTSGELLDADPRRGPVEAIGSGRWGIVLVSTETTDRETRARIKKIRNVIRKQHRDALDLRRVQLARWLETFQREFPHFTRSAIARAVLGRRKGFRRPTKAEVIAGLSMNEEQQLKEKYREAGIPEIRSTHGSTDNSEARRPQRAPHSECRSVATGVVLSSTMKPSRGRSSRNL